MAHRPLSPLPMLRSPATSLFDWPLVLASMASMFSRRNNKDLRYKPISQQTQRVILHGMRKVKTAETHGIMMSGLKEHQSFIFSVLSHGGLWFLLASLYLLPLGASSVSRMSSFSLAKSRSKILNRHYIFSQQPTVPPPKSNQARAWQSQQEDARQDQLRAEI